MITLGMWAGRYREMRPISFGIGGGAESDKGRSAGGTNIESGNGDEEQGFMRGGRGRGRDRAGELGYEMVERDERGADIAPSGRESSANG